MSSTLEAMWNILEGVLCIAPEIESYSPPKPHAPELPNPHIAEQASRELGGVILNEAEHADFIGPIHAMAEKLELGYKPIVVATETIPFGSEVFKRLPNAAGLPNDGVVIVNKGLLELTGDAVTAPISDGMKSFMAHELSHLKYDKAGMILQQMAPVLLPAAAAGALYFYDQTVKSKKNVGELLDAKQEIHQQADAHIADIDAAQNDPHNHLKIESKIHKPLINIARYTAAGMVGLAAALMINRHISIAREFHADRIAAELGGNPEAFSKALTNLIEGQEHGVGQILQNKEALTSIRPTDLGSIVDAIRNEVHVHTTHAHPSLKARLKNIGLHTERLAQQSAAATAHIS